MMALIGCEWCGRTDPSKIYQEVAHLRKKLLYFFIVAPGRRWHVKKKEKHFEKKRLPMLLTFFFEMTMSWGGIKCLSMLWIIQ